MGKSDLKSFLEAAATDEVALSFRQVEILLGESLPAAARNTAWWDELPSHNALASAWTDAGFRPEAVDLYRESVVFGKSAAASELRLVDDDLKGDPNLVLANGCRHPLFGALRGMMTVEPGYDLTQPLFADDYWDKRMDEKYRDL